MSFWSWAVGKLDLYKAFLLCCETTKNYVTIYSPSHVDGLTLTNLFRHYSQCLDAMRPRVDIMMNPLPVLDR
jgi:hypothetical protein